MKNLFVVLGVLIASANAATDATKTAKGKDYCIPGSDSLCKRWGSDYCCAKIEMTNSNDLYTKTYHACASAAGIAAMDGKFSGGPYSGTWFCAGAMEQFTLSTLLFISIAIVNS